MIAVQKGTGPAWDRPTQELVEAQALRDRHRELTASHGWSTSTRVMRLIITGLRAGAGDCVAPQSPTAWFATDGCAVRLGDQVALSITPDTAGLIESVHPDTGLPGVRITAGPGVGGMVYPYPAQILTKVTHSQFGTNAQTR